ncbi:PEP-CTERM/exosortase system-associated acyltransferase [Aquisalimonas asiatica]|uniref:N-acyl amino acid synthase, PEP-CTERM/exosortase system-associated n=1 Tax=Aquisalimonas asiatica TaxID=406100 RepID=A0A1H8U473_9GAMM|nr:PEP-CTERM/exosortase system-associated acyltransferase [Aquisalimonas asiatica]SEO97643.1 N-acyl amino acid synthase, PEP-CTERM/exosortase system-associated [Aquisalimonas asiatica]
MDADTLAASFHSFFRVSLATSPEERERLARVRYEVYCREFGYEREEDCPNGMETDEHDEHAIHGQVVHLSTNSLAGCVRLISPRRDEPLPLETVWQGSLNHRSRSPAVMQREDICEISRLAVPRAFRRRPNERETPIGDIQGLAFSSEEIRTFPMISVGLFLTAISLANACNRPNIFAIMEPRLARLLSRSGLHFMRIGDIKDYHGHRAPYHLHHDDAMLHLRQELHCLYDDITNRLSEDLAILDHV